MTVDVHVHVFPDRIAARAIEALESKAGHKVKPVGDGTIACLLRQMRQAGMEYAVLCPIATRPELFSGILEEAIKLQAGELGHEAAAHLIPFASVHPSDPQRYAHLRQVAHHGIRGVKLHPYYQPCTLDAPETLDFLRCCRDNNLVVQCHCGYDIGFPRDPLCGPERIANVLDALPGLKLIAAHLGGWQQWEEVGRHLLGRDIYLDTSLLPLNLADANALRILRDHRSDRLLFATDWPWLSFRDGIAFVNAAVEDKTARQAIMGGNAARLLGVEE